LAKDFDRILDECIDRINHGETIEACLADYPTHASQLEPLLKAMTQTKAAYSFTPSIDAKRTARQRFYAALEKQRLPSLWQKVLARRFAGATIAAVVVILIISFFVLRMTVFTEQIPSMTVSTPSTEGNFVFLVSDEVNAIGDFTDLKVSIEKVGLLQNGSSERWVEFATEVKEFDLTLLPGDKTQELWRGNIPEGEYTKVVMYVTQVRGTLKATGQTIEIKLPSNKLQISKSFQVSAGNVTSFTYDLTVVKTGNARNGGKYLLKPQVADSGASQKPITADKTRGNRNK
jgi:hypothetical protein